MESALHAQNVMQARGHKLATLQAYLGHLLHFPGTCMRCGRPQVGELLCMKHVIPGRGTSHVKSRVKQRQASNNEIPEHAR